MKGLVKKSLALLLGALMSTGSCVALLSGKGDTVNASSSPLKIMYGEEMSQYFKMTCNRDDSPIVYYGESTEDHLPIDWFVVGCDGRGVARENNSAALTLLSRRSLKDESYARANADDYSQSKLYSDLPRIVSLDKNEDSALKPQSNAESMSLKYAKVWPLSLRQASGLAFSLRTVEFEDGTSTKTWWTRTSHHSKTFVMSDGLIDEIKATDKAGVRPACNVDMTKIAFLTAAGEKGQYLTDGLCVVEENTDNKWKLVLSDSKNQSFSAELTDSSVLALGGEASIEFANAYEAEDAGVFAIISDQNGVAVRYGLIADGSSSSGTATFTIPEDMAEGEYVLNVFSSYYNNGNETEVCTNVASISIKVKEFIPAPGQVSNLKAEMAGKHTVILSWDEYEGVEGYNIYANKEGTFELITTVEKEAETTYTDENALDGVMNKYWVVAFVKDKEGNIIEREVDPSGEADVQCKGGCPAVTGLKATAQTGKVKLTWEASPEADGYLIYGIRPDKAYGYIGMTTQGTAFTDTKASTEGWNFYWVFPYYMDDHGEMIVGGTPKYVYGKAR